MKKDNAIFEMIEREHQRQLKGIELLFSPLLNSKKIKG